MKTYQRTFSIFVTTLVLASAIVSTAQARDYKIGVVHMERLFNEYFKTPQAQKDVDDLQKNMQRQREAMESDLKKLGDEVGKLEADSKDPALADTVRAEKVKLLESKRREGLELRRSYEKFIQTGSATLSTTMEDKHKRILKDITDELTQFAKEENYDFVLDRTGQTRTGLPSLLFAKDEFDVTDALLKRLNAKANLLLPQEKPAESKPAEKLPAAK